MQRILTADGSYTIFNEAIGEHYHSAKGAVTESRHVFIQSGLDFAAKLRKQIVVLEVGLGTGLNALLSLQYGLQHDLSLQYIALELYPLAAGMALALQYPQYIGAPELTPAFRLLHTSDNATAFRINPGFSFTRHQTDVRDFNTNATFNLVYYDAFSPAAQPHLWTRAIFEKLYGFMQTSAVLVTYSAKGQIKRDLKSIGFTVESLPGAPGKREMIRAIKM
ncbi:tRNA (5-methylaminomethyl-2-thiouridine)(34)-methyltransferase MnmD [Chitinophaga sp. 212800010-3]|uniref:tRNA (5-methylaminomethyl-2-thiouridine)(34)-methyltransferase MnmD n=1 Tax=unclassified Chitinophaga TaxID=2619133 RepID=UPI002DED7744|nr:hypothetical protein [Chitinophaga sp. 212800010-3]